MIFQHTIDQVLAGTKTQTRRVVDAGKPCKYDVGKTYSVQPGRGKKGVGRIHIVCINNEHVQDIHPADIHAEGIPNYICKTCGGASLLDYMACVRCDGGVDTGAMLGEFVSLWDSIQPVGRRWVDNPEVYVIEFELVKEESER